MIQGDQCSGYKHTNDSKGASLRTVVRMYLLQKSCLFDSPSWMGLCANTSVTIYGAENLGIPASATEAQ